MSSQTHSKTFTNVNPDLDSLTVIIDRLKHLSRPNLEMVAELIMEKIANEDLASLEKNTAPRHDSLYELTKELSRHVKRRVNHVNVPPSWARADEHRIWFEDSDEDYADAYTITCEECGLEKLQLPGVSLEADGNLLCEHCGKYPRVLNRSV